MERPKDQEDASVIIELSNISADGAKEQNAAKSESVDSPGIQAPNSTYEMHKGLDIWAWATLVSAFFVQFCVAGYASAFGVYQDFYVREFLTTKTSSAISWIGSTQSFLFLTLGFLAGHLHDKGYCRHLVTSGSFVVALSLFMLSLAKPEQYYQVFLTQAIGVGIGGGLSFTPSLAVLSQHYSTTDSRALAMAIAAAGTPIGGLVRPILLNRLLHQRSKDGAVGMQVAFARGTRADAGLAAGLLLIAVLFMRTNYPRKDVEGVSAEDMEKVGHERKPMEFKPMIRRFALDWPYVYFVVGMTLYEMVFFFPTFYLQLKAVKSGLDPTFAFYALCILNGAAFFGRAVPGFFAKSLGVANMLLISTAASTVLIFCMLVVQTVPGVATFAAFYGFFSGALMALMTPLVALLAESPAEIGARMGTCFAFSGLGSLIGTPIAGALLTSRFIWWRPIIFSGIICVVGSLLFAACRVMLGNRKGSFWII